MIICRNRKRRSGLATLPVRVKVQVEELKKKILGVCYEFKKKKKTRVYALINKGNKKKYGINIIRFLSRQI
jgi:hypothetical protein